MENASKALIMAAEVLVGVIILTIAVTLFTTLSDFGRETMEEVELNKIAEWNNTYLKYYGTIKTDIKKEKTTKEIEYPIPVTAHDIATVAASAKQNNINYEFDPKVPLKADDTSHYVQVEVAGINKNLECFSEIQMNEFLSKYSLNETLDYTGKLVSTTKKYFKVDTYPMISSNTKRVIYIKFVEFEPRDYAEYEKTL